ncbi:MAG: type II toxin-antitoxin system RelE/ParE family toxin [Pseudomonadales bacterium]|nr:type II toxin-antitoxin system RelE/ParE family toxin [Pseudomonadales bacterium]
MQRFEELAEAPYQYQAVDHIREGYRRSVCGADSIYYRVNINTVEIMRILGKQDFNAPA